MDWNGTALLAGLRHLSELASAPFTGTWSRTGVLVMLAGWLVGAFAYAHYRPDGLRFTPMRYLRHAFARRVWLSRSAAVDLQLVLFNAIVSPARWMLFGLTSAFAARWLADRLDTALGAHPVAAPGTTGMVMLGVLLFLVTDFASYVNHRMSHRLPLLWAFHRVHHSAEVLNPLTVLRKHPCYDAFAVVMDCVIVAPVQAVILHLWGSDVSASALALANMGFGWFGYAASSLRHTHIWLSYGPVMNRLVMAPALHQMHHSRAPEHWDCNYGEVLSLWDWLAGTLVQPRGREELVFGLGDSEAQPHPGLADALIEPFRYAGRVLSAPGPTVALEQPR